MNLLRCFMSKLKWKPGTKVLKYKLKMIFDINYCGSLDIWTRIRKTILILFNKL